MNRQKHTVTLNREQALFVIPCGQGYSCLGFDVLEDRAARLAAELGEPWNPRTRGTLAAYAAYEALCARGAERHRLTHWRSAVELTPQLVGREGQRVQVVDCYGETRRFWVGKSTGWMPCHLEISRRDSSGGPAVMGAPFQSITTIERSR